MNRRNFVRTLAASVAAASTVSAAPAPAQSASPSSALQPPFPLSVMLWCVFRDLPFEQRLEKIAQAGYTNIELVGEYAKWTSADFDRATAAAKRLGISFDATAGLHQGVGNPAERDALLASFREALTPMETLSCPAMIVLSGNVVPGLSHDAQHQSCIDGLKAMAALVEGRKIAGQPVRILLECIDPEENPKYFLTSAAEAMDIVRAVNHPQVQFLYDLFHEQIAEGNLIEKLERNIDVVGLIHVADVPGRHIPGTGEINYASVYRKLAKLKYQHIVAMEFLPTGDPVAELRAAKDEVIRSTRA
ncbi:TIM barrel protein [Occallatibacter riparius]|uniref:TIM barrel protein n=1 Tax=Occallatibacter riparius TaxID=1002689 RepID=A0A9J7BV11_9BACT|nr:TIM barrel protein [Occallatibacter riparius]UWZ84853.1 TIM barrel protein [Occallatibacter riparius]